MKYHKLKAGETTGTYVMESPVTEADILRMAQQLAMSRLSKGRALTDPKQVFSHLQTLLQCMRTAKSSTQPCKAKTWCALTFKWAPVLAF